LTIGGPFPTFPRPFATRYRLVGWRLLVKSFTEVERVASKQDGRGSGEGLRTAGLLLVIPTLLIVSPLVGFWIGDWLDRRFGTAPWLGIAGLAVGFIAAGRETYRIYRRYQAEEEERNGRP